MKPSAALPELPPRPYAARLFLARAALLWERAWPAMWPALGIAGAFAVLGLFDLLPRLPAALHAAVLAALAAALVAALVDARRSIAIPDRLAARRRLERASGLAHRPLAALADRPSAPLDAPSAQLWETHRRRMAALARRLRVGWPAAGLAGRDPRGLRAVLAILLLLGIVDAGADWRERLAHALAPGFSEGPPPIAASLDIWVTPPDYTGLPPKFLRPQQKGVVAIPTGSKLLAQVHGGNGVPRLVIDGVANKFTAIDKANFQAGATLTKAARLAVSQKGAVLGSWPVRIVPDLPPRVEFTRPPEGTPQAALRLDYRASDDYGVEAVEAAIRRLGGKPGEVLRLPLALPGLNLKLARATAYNDLSANPWAGLPVEIRLVAKDAIGQTGESSAIRMKLPERRFHNPVARAIIDQRKQLVTDPGSREAVAEILGDLRGETKLYHDDAVVFLSLRVAQSELRTQPSTAATAEVLRLLWDTALRIEDGGLSLAEGDLRRLQQKLQQALARNAPNAEIERLMRQLREALQSYLGALAQNLARHPNQALPPLDPNRTISSRELERMLDQARRLAENGDRAAAQRLLSELQDMIENLRTGRPTQAQQKAARGAQQAMRDMRDLMRRQQQLLDESFHAAQQGQQAAPDQPGQQSQTPGGAQDLSRQLSEAAGQQDALRRKLDDIMRRLGQSMGDIPAPFGRAERAMRRATGALQNQAPGAAIGPQTEALDQLQQAARKFAQSMQRQFGAGWGNPGGSPEDGEGGRRGLSRDPLGRPLAGEGGYDEGDVKIPSHERMHEARKIMEELRRRAGERARPPLELDYINRLLERF
ncbi:MAG TPA: TIGR02302 family protein [Stellaceae bacterium]|nr:TIGR02302 family protein [Stellaceae bacterium]